MKKAALLGCMFMTLIGSAQLMMADSTFKIVDGPQYQLIRLSDLNDQVLQDFSQGNRSDLIIACEEGSALPFKLSLKGQFLALESMPQSPLYLKVLKTCFIRCEEQENFLFSTDLQAWRAFSEFFTGELGLSVQVDTGETEVVLRLELDERNS